MDIANTLQMLARDPELCAWRDRGIVIRIRPGLVIERVFIARPYRWQPNYGDLIAMDWRTGTVEQLQKSLQAQIAEAG